MRPEPQNPFEQPPPSCPPRPYQRNGKRLRLPANLPTAISTVFAKPARNRTEAGALLYGLRGVNGAPDEVHALVVPAQEARRANYRIPADAIAAASAATRERGWVTLAQVHTHPGRGVEHSWYDDRHAISSKALSFVVPHYGARADSWLDDVGIHEFQVDWWHLLTRSDAAERVAFNDSPINVIDLRAAAGHFE